MHPRPLASIIERDRRRQKASPNDLRVLSTKKSAVHKKHWMQETQWGGDLWGYLAGTAGDARSETLGTTISATEPLSLLLLQHCSGSLHLRPRGRFL